ncbi:MAG TPA: AAA family ATPase [Candidatus Limnocylindrales bacterium]|nr:AAA family ATPase [Candidatus Limnocylindrales bacterium]
MTHVGQLLSPAIIGRDDHLALAGRRIDEVLAGHGQLLLVSGEAGIGKSRLLAEIRHVAADRGLRVASGEVAPQDNDVLAASFLDLGRAMRRDPAFGTMGPKLLELAASRLHARSPRRRDFVMEVVDLLGGSDTPSVLVFEDLQWADDLGLETLAELARQTRARQLLLVGAYRSGETSLSSGLREWRARLVTQRTAEELRLRRLTRDETADVITGILGSGLPAPSDVVDAIYARTDGVPLHIEELSSALGRERLANDTAILEAAVPETLEDATLARIGRLSVEAQAVARAAAVIGRSFVPTVLGRIMNLPIEALDAPIQELLDNDLLDAPDAGRQLDFRHQLLRDALYRSVPAGDRRRFHARAAEFGAQLEGASDTHASMHFERAGMTEEAFTTALAAAEQAQRMSSHREAFTLFRRAVDNMPASLPENRRVGILLQYAGAAANVDRTALSTEVAAQVRAIALRLDEHMPALEALWRLISVGRRDGDPISRNRERAHQLLSDAAALPEGQDRDLAYGLAMDVLTLVELDACNFALARTLVEEARAFYRKGGSAGPAWIDLSIARLNVVEGRADEGLLEIRSIGEATRALGDEDGGVWCHRDAALYAMRALDFRRARVGIAEGLRYAESVEQTYSGHVLASCEAILSWAEGHWEDALRQGGHALSDPGSGWSRDLAKWAIGYVEAGRGHRERAEDHLLPALEYGRRSERLDLLLPPQWGLAEAALHGGDAGAAAAICDDALHATRALGERTLIAPFAPLAVRAHQAAGHPDLAVQWLDQFVGLVDPAIARPAIEHATGLVRLAEGSVVAARVALQAAVASWDARGRLWEALWARLDLAAALLRSSRFVDANNLLREVRTAATELRSAPLLARADQLLRTARGRGRDQEPWHPLTTREFEVARKIAEGRTNAELAEELSISPKTASSHVEHILAKLGVSRRAEIARWAESVAPGATRR